MEIHNRKEIGLVQFPHKKIKHYSTFGTTVLIKSYKYVEKVSDIMRSNNRRDISKFREPELERAYRRAIPVLRKMKKIKIPGESE